MLRAMALLLAFASGCYDYEGLPQQCVFPDGSVAHGAQGLSCPQVERHLWTARTFLVERSLASPEEATAATTRVALVVKPVVYWQAPPGLVDGEYIPEADAMVIGRNGFAIVHEVLHRLDVQRGHRDGTLEHVGWVERGFDAALREAWPTAWPRAELYP